METVELDAKSRDTKVHARNLLKMKLLPAVFYGKGEQSVTIQMDYQVFRKVFIKAGSNSLVDLNVDGKKKGKVLIHDIQYNPLTGTMTHVDFLHVNMKEEITTMVPVELTGVSTAVKDDGGILTTVKHEIEVKCLPSDIPHNIQIDISTLVDFIHPIHVSDLVVPKGVAILDNPEDVVVTVSAPRKEEDVVAPVATGIEGTAAEAAAKEDAVKAAAVGSEKKPEKKEEKK